MITLGSERVKRTLWVEAGEEETPLPTLLPARADPRTNNRERAYGQATGDDASNNGEHVCRAEICPAETNAVDAGARETVKRLLSCGLFFGGKILRT